MGLSLSDAILVGCALVAVVQLSMIARSLDNLLKEFRQFREDQDNTQFDDAMSR